MGSSDFVLRIVCLIACVAIANAKSNKTAAREDVVPQCRCGGETEQCFLDLGISMALCNGKCGNILERIGDPEKLTQCFIDQQVFGESVKKCVLKKGTVSCHDKEDTKPPQIRRIDLRKEFEIELKRAIKLGRVVSRHPLLKNYTNIIETLGEHARCLNNCSDNNRLDGSCFSKNGCQLKKDEDDDLMATVFQCAIAADNGQIAAACDCIADAGVSIAPLCEIISVYFDKSDHGSGLDKASFKP